MKPIAALFFFAVAPAFMASTANAHHSAAKYDSTKTITIDGTIKKYEWANPHVYIYVVQAVGAGKTVEWEIEGGPPSILHRQGWSRDTLHVGDPITVSGHPAKNTDDKSLFPTSIEYAGKILFDQKNAGKTLATAGAAPNVKAASLDGVWVTLFLPKDAALLQKLNNPKIMKSDEMTENGMTAIKNFDEKTMNPAINCIPYPSPIFMTTPDAKRIRTQGDVILIDGSFDAATRTIHMNISSHDGAPFSNQGHSIGRWEGESLVIDTAHFSNHASGIAFGLPSGPGKHLVERLTLNEDRKSLTYHFELSDPDYLVKPMIGDIEWVYRPDLTYAPDKCNLDDARRFIKN